MIIDFLKRKFSQADAPIDLSRRRVLKGAAGLAAVAVVATSGGWRLLDQLEINRLYEMVRSGRVVDQIFYLDRPAVFENLSGVSFLRCQFIAMPGFVGSHLVHFKENNQFITMEECCFDTRAMDANTTALLFGGRQGFLNDPTPL